MFKKIAFQLHWLMGITAGIVLAIVGVTGAALSFQDELLEALNRGVLTISPQSPPPLRMHELVARVHAAYPDKQVLSVNVFSAPDRAARVTFVATGSVENAGAGQQRRRGEVRYVDPYTGASLSKDVRGQELLRTIERVHRGMVAGPTGRAIVGGSTVALVFIAFSGLYLRWPRSGAGRWRNWTKIHGSLKGRAFLWNLHTVIGTFVLPFYLLASLTGLYMAYDWYRQGVIALVGATPLARDAPKLLQPSDGSLNLEQIWTAFEIASGGYESATLTLPPSRNHAVEIRYLAHDAAHERATDRIAIHPVTAEVIKQERFADKSAGDRFVGGIFPLHSGGYFGIFGKVVVMLAGLAMPLFAITGWMMYLQRRKAKDLASKSATGNFSAAAPESA